MNKKITLQIKPSQQHTYEFFIEEMNRNGLASKFEMSQINLPVYTFANDFFDHIAEHGMSSLLNYTIALEDVTSPSTHINMIEATYKRFVRTLAPTKTLIIVDAYFYNGKPHQKTEDFLGTIIAPVITTLEKVISISKDPNGPAKQAIHNKLKSLNQNLVIVDHASSEFHDRFWISPENVRGIVMGTSLNGIGRKISLIDKLSRSDVVEILTLIQSEGFAIS